MSSRIAWIFVFVLLTGAGVVHGSQTTAFACTVIVQGRFTSEVSCGEKKSGEAGGENMHGSDDNSGGEAEDPCGRFDDPAQYLECQRTPLPYVGQLEDDDPPPPTPEQAAQRVIAKLRFTAATPQLGPDRDQHDYPFDTAVGYPVWLWTIGGTMSDSVLETVGPLRVAISVRLDKVVWNMGDGTTLRCDRGTKWRRGTTAGKKSPTCGHTYEKAGKYTVEATSRWTINWSAGDQTGTVPYTITADRPFEVGEIHVLVR